MLLRRSPIEAASGAAITDLTLRPRAAAKGPGLNAFLQAKGFMAGETVNRAYRQADGSLLARLSPTEILWLGADASDADLAHWQSPDGDPLAPQLYAVPRTDGSYWFHLSADATAEIFPRVCNIDLSPAAFADLHVAQTLMARTSAVIIRDGLATHIVGDISLAAYIWEVLHASLAPPPHSGR